MVRSACRPSGSQTRRAGAIEKLDNPDLVTADRRYERKKVVGAREARVRRQAISVWSWLRKRRCRERIERDSFGPRILPVCFRCEIASGQTPTHDVEEACIYRGYLIIIDCRSCWNFTARRDAIESCRRQALGRHCARCQQRRDRKAPK
jgi:hypothetical protein